MVIFDLICEIETGSFELKSRYDFHPSINYLEQILYGVSNRMCTYYRDSASRGRRR